MTMQGAPTPTAIAPTWTWGSSATLRADNTTAPGPPPQFGRVVSAQLAQVSLPEPAVCTIYFQVAMSSAIPSDVIEAFTVNLNQGVGRTTIPRQLTYLGQPALGAPLEVTIPFIPLHALNVDVTMLVKLNNPAGSLVVAECYLELSPITRIPQKEQKLAFGMGLPGEADALDDALLEDLEGDSPSVQEAVLGELQPDDGDDGDGDGPRVQEPPPWLFHLIRRMGRRLGRPPTKDELRHAIKRRRQRHA